MAHLHRLCGCLLTCIGDTTHDLTITYCPTHEAAPELKYTLKTLLQHLEAAQKVLDRIKEKRA